MTDETSGASVVHVAAGDDLGAAIADAPAGAAIELADGAHEANLNLTKSVTMRGSGPDRVTLSGGGTDSVLAVHADDIEVQIEGVTLTGGSATQGGGLMLTAMSKVSLTGCVLRDNTGRQGPGGAIYADMGTVVLERCRIEDNAATDAAAALIDQIATLVMSDSSVTEKGRVGQTALWIRDGAEARLTRVTVVATGGASALRVAGTSSRVPEVSVHDSDLSGAPALELPEPFPGQVEVSNTELRAATRATGAAPT